MITKENLSKARSNKNDEFYTRYIDIENEIVYCNCDDFYISNFFKYFYNNFQELKLKKLITTSENIQYKVTRLKKGMDGKDLKVDGKTKYVRIILTPI